MKVFNFFAFYSLLLFLGFNRLKAEDTFTQSLNDFNFLQDQINRSVSPVRGDCATFMYENSKELDRCELKNYCDKFQKELSSAFLINQNGEQMLNEEFVMANLKLRSCLKGTFKDDIAAAIQEFKEQKKADNLKLVYDLNQKLKKVLAKNNEYNNFAKINRETLSLRLEDSMNGEYRSMKELISLAQKKLKLKLSKEALDLIVKIDIEVENPKYFSELKKFERSFYKELELPNKFYDFEQFVDQDIAGGADNLVANQKMYQQKAKEVHAEFLKVKKAMVSYLLKQKNKKNEAQINRAIERVSLVKFHTPVLSNEMVKACEFPNAWYNPESQQIFYCPQWFNLPKVNIFEILSHELSHSIDPCTFQAPLKILRSKADIINPGPFEVDLELEKLNQSSSWVGELGNEDLGEKDQKLISLKDNPFNDTISCLQSKKSIGAIVPSKDQLKDKIEKALEKIKAGVTNYKDNENYQYLKAASENIDKYYEHYGLCNLEIPGGVSQIGEAFADKLAAELIVDRISAYPKDEANKELEKLILAGIKDSHGICPESKLVKEMKALGVKNGCHEYIENQKIAEKIYRGMAMASESNTDEHPDMNDRINKILFAHPKIRELLNCSKRGGAKYCEN